MRVTSALMSIGLVAACGNDNNGHIADAPPASGDAPLGADAQVIDAPPRPVTVVVTNSGEAANNVTVYFLKADSSLVSEATTDGSGSASVVMAAGGSVTVIAPPPTSQPRPRVSQSFQLDTWLGVQPGDVLHLDVGDTSGSFNPVDPEITFHSDPNVAGAQYDIDTTCGQATDDNDVLDSGFVAPDSIALDNCNGSASILVISTDGSGSVDSFYAPDQAVATDTTLSLTANWVALDPGAVALTHVASTTTDYSVERELLADNGFVFEAGVNASVGSGTASGNVPFPAAASIAGATVTTFINEVDVNGTFDVQGYAIWGAPSDGTTLDVSTVALPRYTSSPSFDTTTQQLQWTSGTAAVAADFEVATVEASRNDGADQWTWTIAAPGSQYGAVQFPTLPTDVFSFAFADGDDLFVDTVDAAHVPGGYDLVRAFVLDDDSLEPVAVFGTSGSAAESSVRPSDARVRGHRLHAAPAHRHAGHRAHGPKSVPHRR